jgi:hypothetical protein
MKAFWKKYKTWIIGFWGFSTTILSLYLTVYPLEQNAHLTFYQKSNVDVFTIDQPIDELQITINGQNIRKKNLNLCVYKFKLVNDGKRDIKEIDYVKAVAFGMRAKNGKIARINFFKPVDSNQKLLKKLSLDSTKAYFNPIYFSKNSSITFDVWIVHKKGVEPQIFPTGKIADTGIDLTDDREGHRSWWEETKDELIGLIKFFLTVLIPQLFIAFLAIYILIFLVRRLKKFLLKRKFDWQFDSNNRAQKALIKLYSISKKKDFKSFLEIITDNERLNNFYWKVKNLDLSIDSILETYKSDDKLSLEYNYASPEMEAIETLLEMGLAKEIPHHNITIDSDLVQQAKILLKTL